MGGDLGGRGAAYNEAVSQLHDALPRQVMSELRMVGIKSEKSTLAPQCAQVNPPA